MLLKLIKHNLRPIFKSILPFIIALFVSVILFNVTDYTLEYVYGEVDGIHTVVDIITPSELQMFLHGLFNFATNCSMILLIAASVRAVCHQFKTNFYSDRAYLTHTLPVKRSTLWNAECASVLITLLTVLAVLVINCLLLSLTVDGTILLESFGLVGGCPRCLNDYYSVEVHSLGFYFCFAFIVFTEFVFLTLCGITGIIIAHRVGKNIKLVAGLGVYFLGSIILLAIFYLIGKLFDQDIFQISSGFPDYTPGYNPDISFIARALLYIGSIYFCYCVVLYFVDQKLLRRGINLD